MSTTRAALDELDDATFELVAALHLEDAAEIKRLNEDGDHDSPDSAEASQVFTTELLQYREDRRYQKKETTTTESSDEAACAEPQDIQCVICEDQVLSAEVWNSPCGHHYCVACLETLLRVSMTTENKYPPGCCDSLVPWDKVRSMIDQELASAFEKKREELDTDPGRRVYCSDPACASFIGASKIINDVASCPTCSKASCTRCKAAGHEGDCPKDEAVQQTLQYAEDQGWRRCNVCQRMVEIISGCNHMV